MKGVPFFRTFFEEKQIDLDARFEIDGPSGANSFSYGVVIDHIMIAPSHEQSQIELVLRRIDFANGDVRGYLRHLAGALTL